MCFRIVITFFYKPPFDACSRYSFRSSLKKDHSISISVLGRLYSTILPLLITSTQVQSTTVGIRCATVITVLPLNSVLIIFWIIASVAVSMDAVASSRIKMQFLLNSARAKQSNCLWPMLQFDPPSTICESNPCLSLTASISWHLPRTWQRLIQKCFLNFQ